jgi:hypothetical protein
MEGGGGSGSLSSRLNEWRKISFKTADAPMGMIVTQEMILSPIMLFSCNAFLPQMPMFRPRA